MATGGFGFDTVVVKLSILTVGKGTAGFFVLKSIALIRYIRFLDLQSVSVVSFVQEFAGGELDKSCTRFCCRVRIQWRWQDCSGGDLCQQQVGGGWVVFRK